MSDPAISILVPVYRAEATLEALHSRIVAVMTAHGQDFECIFVEDGGGDRSWEIISELCCKDGRVRGFKMARNFGQHNALLAAIRMARGQVLVTLDDDLQDPPEEIPKLLASLEQGHDVVYGVPETEQHGFFRDLASQTTKLVLRRAVGADFVGKVSAFRAFRASLRDAFQHYESVSPNIDVLLAWGTARYASVIVGHEPRKIGNSGYTPRKLLTHAFNMITGFTTLPLQLASLVGFVFGTFGFLLLTYVLTRYFIDGYEVRGFTFLSSLLSILFGVNMFLLGVFGEYLGRVHLMTMGRSSYLISKRAEYATSAGPGLTRAEHGASDVPQPSAPSGNTPKDFILDYWQGQAVKHQDSYWASWGDKWMIELEIETIGQEIQEGDLVLDIGCANGHAAFQQLARRKPRAIVGVDFSEKMIAIANEVKSRDGLGGNITFETGDVRKLHAPDDTYDVVYTTRVLINLPTWESQCDGIRECIRVARPGGKIIFSEGFWEPLVMLNAMRALAGLPPLVEHDFNRYLKMARAKEFLVSLGHPFRVEDFSSVYYLGSRLVRELVTDPSAYPGYENPINGIFFDIERNFSGGEVGIQQAIIVTKRGDN